MGQDGASKHVLLFTCLRPLTGCREGAWVTHFFRQRNHAEALRGRGKWPINGSPGRQPREPSLFEVWANRMCRNLPCIDVDCVGFRLVWSPCHRLLIDCRIEVAKAYGDLKHKQVTLRIGSTIQDYFQDYKIPLFTRMDTFWRSPMEDDSALRVVDANAGSPANWNRGHGSQRPRHQMLPQERQVQTQAKPTSVAVNSPPFSLASLSMPVGDRHNQHLLKEPPPR
jgi:hypothetical protein